MPLPEDKKHEIIRDNFQLTGEVKMSAERLRKKLSNTLDKVHDEAVEGEREKLKEGRGVRVKNRLSVDPETVEQIKNEERERMKEDLEDHIECVSGDFGCVINDCFICNLLTNHE